jgi:hypothetical protein
MTLTAALIALPIFLAGLGVILYGMGSMSGGADEASEAQLNALVYGDWPDVPSFLLDREEASRNAITNEGD